jgi:hypothetical protein
VNRRDRRAAGIRGKVIDLEPVRLVVDHLRAIGCVCDPPHVYFDSGPMRWGEVGSISVAHDDWCPLAPNRYGRGALSALIVYPPDGGES